jgi:DNA-directed RNA polymerase
MDKDFILKAESPFMFSSFCLIIKELDKNKNYLVKLPVTLDATCSGIQHFAGLLLDFELASQVNLIESNKVNDIYKSLINPINKAINDYGMNNSIKYSNFTYVRLSRRELKSVIMTKSYNVTTHGIKGQLLGKFEESENKRIIYYKPKDSDIEHEFKVSLFKVPSNVGEYIELTEYEIMKMATIINDNIFTTYPSLNSIYNYLTEIANIMCKLNLPIS